MSPTSLKLTFAQLQRGRELTSLKDCLQMVLLYCEIFISYVVWLLFRVAKEYTLVQACMEADFHEGVRSVLVDKVMMRLVQHKYPNDVGWVFKYVYSMTHNADICIFFAAQTISTLTSIPYVWLSGPCAEMESVDTKWRDGWVCGVVLHWLQRRLPAPRTLVTYLSMA